MTPLEELKGSTYNKNNEKLITELHENKIGKHL
jgi:hypothetical protein